MRVRGTAAFTLLEALLAVALAAIVVGAAARGLVGSRRAATATSHASESVLTQDLAADLLAREVRRAGYLPASSPTSGPSWASSAALELTIHPGRPSGDAVRLRYLDDRLAGPPIARDLTFEAGLDGRGAPQLYRVTGSGAKQPLVEGVTGLRVVGWADAGGLHDIQELAPGTLQPWLLVLRLSTRGAAGARTVAVPLPSRPSVSVVVVP